MDIKFGLEKIWGEYEKYFISIKNKSCLNSAGSKAFFIRVKYLCDIAGIKYEANDKNLFVNEEGLERISELLQNLYFLYKDNNIFYNANQVSELLNKANKSPIKIDIIFRLQKEGKIRLATLDGKARYFYKKEVDEIAESLNLTIDLATVTRNCGRNSSTVYKIIGKLKINTINSPVNKAELRICIDDYVRLAEEFPKIKVYALKYRYMIDTKSDEIVTNNRYVDYLYLREVYLKYHNTTKSARCLSTEQTIKKLKRYLEASKINYYISENNIFAKREDIEKLESIYKNFNVKNYYTTEEIRSKDLLGIYTMTQTLYKYVTPFFYKGKYYFPKDQISYLVSMKRTSVQLLKIVKRYGFLKPRPVLAIIKDLEKEGRKINVIDPKNHPFNTGSIVSFSDAKSIIRTIKISKALEKIEETYDKFIFLTSKIKTINNGLDKSLNDFCDFVFDRYKNIKHPDIKLSSHIRIYKNLTIYLYKSIEEYSSADLELFVKSIKNTKGHCKRDEGELHLFLTFINKKYPWFNLKTTIYKNNTKSLSSNGDSYTKEQWCLFKKLVFESINNREVLDLALAYRGFAMAWLYCALHYVTAWRAEDIYNIPKPDLNIMDFSSGYDFIEFIKGGGDFNEVMGEIICYDVNLQINALGRESEKNGEILRFIVGKSKLRTIGFLLALCESHRRIAKKYKDRLIVNGTARKRDTHLKLFGKKYEEIFGENYFSNTKATNTHLKIIQEEGEELGLYLASLMRPHKVIDGIPSRITADVYVTHGYVNEDRDLDKITFNLMERGVFSFAAYKLLYAVNKNIKKLDYFQQTDRIKMLGLSPYKVENISKNIIQRKSEIDDLIDRMITSGQVEIIHNSIIRIGFGNDPAKHHYTDCLLKSLLYSGMERKVLPIKDSEGQVNCLFPLADNCIGCPFLIAEKYFLIELGKKIIETVSEAEIYNSRRDMQKYGYLIKVQKNILKQAIVILGREKVKVYIDIEKVFQEWRLFEELSRTPKS